LLALRVDEKGARVCSRDRGVIPQSSFGDGSPWLERFLGGWHHDELRRVGFLSRPRVAAGIGFDKPANRSHH
jgi:hypothetical protein